MLSSSRVDMFAESELGPPKATTAWNTLGFSAVQEADAKEARNDLVTRSHEPPKLGGGEISAKELETKQRGIPFLGQSLTI